MASLIIGAVVQVGLSLALQALNKPEDQTVEEGQINEARITVATMGSPIMWGFGRIRVGGNLIWSGPITEVKTERESGGKGFGGGTTNHVSYSYFGNFAVAVGKGTGTALRKVWFDKTIWYDAAPGEAIATNTTAGSSRSIKNEEASVRFYSGNETQEPDPLMVSFDTDFVPAYRGICYVVFGNVPLTEHGNRIPQIEIEASYSDIPGQIVNTWLSTGFNPEGGGSDPMISWSPTLRKIWTTSVSNVSVIDMDGVASGTFPIEANVVPTEAKYTVSYDEGGFAYPGDSAFGFRARSPVYSFPNGRTFIGGDCHSTVSAVDQKIAEFNPFTLDTINQGAWAPSTTGAVIDGGYAGSSTTMTAATTQWTNVGFLSGVYVVYAVGTGGADTPIVLHFYWLDKKEAIKSYAVEIPGNFGKVDGMVPDRNGFMWIFTYDRDIADTSPRGVAFKLSVSYDMGLIPGFADQVKVSYDRFDLSAHSIHDMAAVYYDLPSDSFMIISDAVNGESFQRVSVWDHSTDTIVREDATTYLTATYGTMTAPWFTWGSTSNGYGHVAVSGHITYDIVRIDFVSLLPFGYEVPVSFNSGDWFHIPGQNATWFYFGDDWNTLRWDSVEEVDTTLDSVINDIIEKVGIDPVTEATLDAGVQATVVGGYQFPGTFSARQALDRISFAYTFDVAEVDGKLGFFSRGASASAATATDSEQGYGRSAGELSLQLTRTQDVEVPARVDVVHLDPFREQQEGIQSAIRQRSPDPTTASSQSRKVELGISLSQDQAAQLAEVQLYSTWVNRDRYETALPTKYLQYDPTDVITLTDEDGVGRQVRLTQTGMSNAYTVQVEGVLEDLDAYTSVTGGAPSTVPLDALADPGPCRPVVMDIPLLRDTDNVQQRAVALYTGFAAYSSVWSGGTLEKSIDGINFSNLDVNALDTPWGYLRSALEPEALVYLTTSDGLGEEVHWPGNAYRFDLDASITVQLIQGGDSLASATREAVLAGANAIFVGGEIMQFSTVTAGSQDGEYILSDLVRGRRGTEYQMTRGHRYGTEVYLLEAATLSLAVFEVTDRGKNIQFRSRSNGQIFNSTNREDVILAGNTAVPYQVALPTVDTLADGTARAPIDLTWNRRTRVGGEDDWLDGDVSIAVSERYERYEVVLLEQAAADADTNSDGVTFDFSYSGSGETPLIRIDRNGGSSFFTYGFTADDFVDLEIYGTSTGTEPVVSAGASGRYQVQQVTSSWITLKGTSDNNGNVAAFQPDLEGVSGRLRTVQDESKVYKVSTPSVTITSSDMTDAGYTDGDRLDLAIYQMFFPTADSNIFAGLAPTGERGRALNIYI